jgi:hypothetical protein
MALPRSANKFSKEVNAWVKARGLKAYDAAEVLRVRHQRWYTWSNGQCLPSRAEAERIAAIMAKPALVDLVVRLRRRRAGARARRTAGAA